MLQSGAGLGLGVRHLRGEDLVRQEARQQRDGVGQAVPLLEHVPAQLRVRVSLSLRFSFSSSLI